VSEEDARHLHRTWETVQQDRSRVISRIRGLLTTMGVRLRLNGQFLTRVEAVRLWNNTPLPDGMKQRLTREWHLLALLDTQLQELETIRTALKPDPQTPTGRYVKSCRRCGPSVRSGRGCWRPRFSGGGRFTMAGNEARWWD
jgi:transposase